MQNAYETPSALHRAGIVGGSFHVQNLNTLSLHAWMA